jgi:multisubunit Na+/H+ antiporter MnhB subunit
MVRCSNCNQSFTGKVCPNCGSTPALKPAQINKALNRHTWLILGGLFGTIVATWRYPLLDQDPILGLALFLFFAPILIYLVLAVRKRAGANLKLLRKTFTWAGGAVVSLVFLLLVNGAFDTHPSSIENTVVTRKSVAHGRGGNHYTIRVSPSWRPGRKEEKLSVSGRTFAAVSIGQAVAVEVHPGALGLSWFTNIAPR